MQTKVTYLKLELTIVKLLGMELGTGMGIITEMETHYQELTTPWTWGTFSFHIPVRKLLMSPASQVRMPLQLDPESIESGFHNL